MAEYLKPLLCLVLTLAVEYVLSNNAGSSTGGKMFEKQVGADYAKQTLDSAADFTLKLFHQSTVADRKNVQQVNLIVENMDGLHLYVSQQIAYCSNDEIHESSSFIERFPRDWDGNGQALSGLIEGIADYVRLKAGYAADYWGQPGHGGDWNQGYDVTARFLDYCNGIKNGFVAYLNSMMKSQFSLK
ncbi:Basic secretory protease [Glycine max]|nr:Basic secretory protease [Glycine max]